MYKNIFNPIKIGELTLKNKIIFAPTSMGDNQKKNIEKIINIAKGGVGLIILGDISVVETLQVHTSTLSENKFISYFKKITNEVKKYGCKISVQLFHPDYNVKYVKSLYVNQKKSRDEIRKLLKENIYSYTNELSLQEILNIKDAFVKAALRAEEAGFDMIQIHGDRLLGSFSSSIFNNRKDLYGGTVENRVKLSKEIVKMIKVQLPYMPIDYKLPIRKENPCIGKGGPSLKEVNTFVKVLDKAGVDSFHVTIANHSRIQDTIPMYNHPFLKGEGCFLDLSTEVKKYTNKIVCGLGKLSTPQFIEEALENNKADVVALSRQLIADENWVLKVKDGREKDILYCEFCNIKCTNALMNNKEFGCVLHR
ncbi:bilirubin reductase [Clostridium rectalis]|uniref:bilirubin reductase n=1 Tax=Clostridium rectalis TaxID=2040295 RepID=UPI000F6352B7|nr:bilirubin reductase [Clostridium rectalis]